MTLRACDLLSGQPSTERHSSSTALALLNPGHNLTSVQKHADWSMAQLIVYLNMTFVHSIVRSAGLFTEHNPCSLVDFSKQAYWP